MKKSILTLALVALSTFAVSCSTDDSALQNDANATLSTSTTITIDNGDKDLPKPPMRN
jgi:hypothetical protein